MTQPNSSPESASESCADECALVPRREFLRESVVAIAGAMIALGLSPRAARALPVYFGTGQSAGLDQATYPIPADDGAMIDRDNQVILVRYQGSIFAFSLSCPHQNTALKWLADEGRFQCPKHKSRYQPDGNFISGRATRGMDRFAIRKDGDHVIVDLASEFHQDKDPAGWGGAKVVL